MEVKNLGGSKFIWAIIPGHGGLWRGKYDTAPKKQHIFNNGLTFFEGVYNRERKNMLLQLLEDCDYSYVDLVPEHWDVSLAERVRRGNELYKKHKNLIWVEIHANAGRGYGFEIFTSPGQTKSDQVADYFIEEYAGLSSSKGRYDTSDGDKDKEAKFYNLINTACPAILIEDGFMDNEKDAANMLSFEGLHARTKANFEAIENYEKNH